MPSTLIRLVREPLVHFLAIGAALFLLFHYTNGGRGGGRIVITPGQLEHLRAGFARTWQRPPSDAELKGLVDEYVREEIASREAAAMGLDRDDTIIRRRLRQKLEFVMEEAAEAAPPTDAELQAWLDAHADAFRLEPQLAFRQVCLDRSRRGAATEVDAKRLLARLAAAGAGASLEGVSDIRMLPDELELSPQKEVVRVFGSAFAEALRPLPLGRWSGPVESSFGLHLVLVRERVEGREPRLADVRADVEREFLAERRREQLEATYRKLLERYSVVVEKAKTP